MLFENHITKKALEILRPNGSNVPCMCGLPKTHKSNSPVRPVISMTESPYHPLSKCPFKRSCLQEVLAIHLILLETIFVFLLAPPCLYDCLWKRYGWFEIWLTSDTNAQQLPNESFEHNFAMHYTWHVQKSREDKGSDFNRASLNGLSHQLQTITKDFLHSSDNP